MYVSICMVVLLYTWMLLWVHSNSFCWRSKLSHAAWASSVLVAVLSKPHSFCIWPLAPPICYWKSRETDKVGKPQTKLFIQSSLVCEVLMNNEWTVHLLSHSPHLSPFWILSRSAEESTPSPDPPESAVIEHSQQTAATGERRQEKKDERGAAERYIY